ncbi:S8 family serine peptidase [Niveibacterium microcysteis]|uniref:S8 family serine peptidase n=1 Tax=Niveibacterium microcysteis TaxID=2811415 RepID=A0ABX7M5H8_9RHOO|nr:S8 family serine peptidase [Niveibacterium microcysteis]QSI77002.1 S8 family serine peptidase [Niveibacterium microcysteis]
MTRNAFRMAAMAAAIAALGLGALSVPAVAGQNSDNTAARPTQDTSVALVVLNGDPLSTYVKTKPAKGKKIDFGNTNVKAYRAQLSALRNDYKAWLRANVPGAKVTGEFDIALNAVAVQLNGASLAQVSGTSMVKSAQYQALYYPSAADPDLALISAPAAWATAGGSATAGDGIRVAIVDSGIDTTHPCFADTGYPAQTQVGDRSFTNNKVIAAKVFSNRTPQRGYTAEAVGEHGTHVAGTVACNFATPAKVGNVTIPYGISGVAPRALLGNYNVFPGDLANARSEDILNALEAAYADGFDVANMSLGGGSHGAQDLLTVAVDNLDQANMVVAVANGNSGPGFSTVESPGMAARALSAGASTVPHFVGVPISAAGGSYGGATGDFGTVTAPLTAPLAVVTGSVNGLNTACSALPAGSLSGQIALITRGTCSFSTKIRNVQGAGAAAVVVSNNVAGTPIAMGTDGTAGQPTIPAYMVALEDGMSLKAAAGAATTISNTAAYFLTSSANADIMAGFSSQGPTDVDVRVKPDVVAPGVNVLSSIPHQFCSAPPCFAFFQGTSMATPHLAGSAAIVRQQHPDWSAANVRSAIVNTADWGVLKAASNGSTIVYDGNTAGAGRENLAAAVNAKVALDPVSVSFGAVPSGSGQTRSATVTLTNLSGAAQTYSLAVGPVSGSGVGFSVSTPSVTLAAGASTTVSVSANAAQGATAGGKQAVLWISSGGAPVAHAVLYTLVK